METRAPQQAQSLYKQLLNNASQILSFSKNVMDKMGAISYRKDDFTWLFHATGPLAPVARLKKIKRHENNEIACHINRLTQEEGRISVQTPAVNTKVHFLSLSNQSKMYDVFRITNVFRVLNVHTCLKESSTEDCESQSSWQEIAQNQTGQLLQLRKQHRIPGYVLSPVSTHVKNRINKTATTVTTKHIEIPQAPRLPDVLSPRAVTKNVSEKKIFSELPLQRVTIEGLKRALSDPYYPVRLEAILTCALGAINGPQEELDPGKAEKHSKGCQLKADPQDLQALIVSALDDPVKRVQMAAAVCQYAMRTPNACARDILRSTLKQGADSWVAAQCLVTDGDASQAVIQRLLSQHFLKRRSFRS